MMLIDSGNKDLTINPQEFSILSIISHSGKSLDLKSRLKLLLYLSDQELGDKYTICVTNLDEWFLGLKYTTRPRREIGVAWYHTGLGCPRPQFKSVNSHYYNLDTKFKRFVIIQKN